MLPRWLPRSAPSPTTGTIGNSAHMAAVIKAQNKFEKGKQTVSDAAIDNGIKLANGDKTVPLTNQATGAVTLADPKAMAQAAEQALNVATIVERINNMRTLGKAQGKSRTPRSTMRSGSRSPSPPRVRAMGEQIRNSAAALYVDGNVQPGAIAAADDRIREIAAQPQFRGREQEVIGTLRGYLQEAQTQASRRPPRSRRTTSAPPSRPSAR